MSTSWVLSFPQIDKPDRPILVQVSRKDGHKHELDLDLLATDGDVVYRGKVRNRDYSTKIKAKHYDGTDQDFAALLRHVLVSRQGSGISKDQRQNLEIDCSISGKDLRSRLSISLRTRIEDITHRLGSVDLEYSDDTSDVDLFGWTCHVVAQRDELTAQVSAAEHNTRAAAAEVEVLQKELDELVIAKREHETQMLSKFMLLLNEKKLRIRTQNRILASVNVDSAALKSMQLTAEGAKLGDKSSVHKKKRRKDSHKTVDDDESDYFSSMDIDKDVEPKSGAEETDSLDPATATEDDTDADAEGMQAQPRFASPPPPPRALPFQKQKSKAQTPQKVAAAGNPASRSDEETESEDDEL